MEIVLHLLLIWNLCHYTQAGICSDPTIIGQSDLSLAGITSPDTRDINGTLIMTGAMFTVPCCGVLSKWNAVVEGAGTAWLQIWRPVPGQPNNYTCLGGNRVRSRSAAVSTKDKNVLQRFRIQVVPDDIIGIYNVNSSIVQYVECDPAVASLCEHDVYYTYAEEQPVAGDVMTFNAIQSTSYGVSGVRGYAFNAYIIPKRSTTCTDETVTISDTLGAGDLVVTMRTLFIDLSHPNSSITFDSVDPLLLIAMNPDTGEVTVNGALSPAYPSSTGTATLRVRDVCGGEGTCLLTVTITNDPKDIVFSNLPANVEVKNTLSSPATLHTFGVSPQRDVDVVTCAVETSTVSIDWFLIRNISDTEFEVHANETLSFGTDNEPVAMLISCVHTGGVVNQSLLTLSFKEADSTDMSLYLLLSIIGGVFLLAAILAVSTCLIRKGCKKACSRKVKPKQEANSRTVKLQKVMPLTHFPSTWNTTSPRQTKQHGHTDALQEERDMELSTIPDKHSVSQNEGSIKVSDNPSTINKTIATSNLSSGHVTHSFIDLSDPKSPRDADTISPEVHVPVKAQEWTLAASNLAPGDKIRVSPKSAPMSPTVEVTYSELPS